MANLQCIVCGRGSTRAVWNNVNVQGTTNVACDFHSRGAISLAVLSGNLARSFGYNLPRTQHEPHTS